MKNYFQLYYGIQSTYLQPAPISVDFSELPININNLEFKPKPLVDFAVQAEHKLRDGELTLFRRPGSRIWQFKYKQNNGKWHRATTKKTIRDENGIAKSVEFERRVRPWWFISESGKVCINIRYGAKVIELAKGKTAVEVASGDELIKTLELIKKSVEAGELDAQIEIASTKLKEGFKR